MPDPSRPDSIAPSSAAPDRAPATPGLAPDLPAVDHMLCFTLYSASHAFTRFYKTLLDPLGLTYPQYLVMVTLWARDDQPVGAIGEALSLESSTLTPLLKRLEAMGNVTRSRDGADERVVRVRLTPQGRDLKSAAGTIPGCILAATGLDLEAVMQIQRDVARLRDALEHATASVAA